MGLDMDVNCIDCEDGTVVYNQKIGKVFVYRWFQCTSCGETDWQSKTLKKKGILEWVS